MKKEEKAKQVESIREELSRAKGVVLSKFEGITVAQDSELRREVARSGARYKVVKNSVIERAAQGTPVEPVMAAKLKGTTSVAVTDNDPVALAKALTNYAKDNPVLVFKAGVVEGRVVSLDDFLALASLPSKEALHAKALFLIKAPATQVASAIAGVGRKLAVVIQQAVKEKKFAEA
jgi:large subunit ribosomal protein L10